MPPKLEARARSRRKRKSITKQLGDKVLRPIGAYNSERYALVEAASQTRHRIHTLKATEKATSAHLHRK
jgi:hypothetical protein